jgi:hypothetical protein
MNPLRGHTSASKIPHFIPHTSPTPPDQPDRTSPTPPDDEVSDSQTKTTRPDQADRLLPLHNPSVVGSIPTGPTTTGPTSTLAGIAVLHRCSQSSRREQCDCRRCHDRGREPSQNIGRGTVHAFAHEALATRHAHHDKEERSSCHTVDHCHQDEHLDGIDVQETEPRAANCSHEEKAVEDRCLAGWSD